MPVTLADAARIVEAAIAKAREHGFSISVTVCDADGRIILLHRMDDEWAEANRASIGKAIAAVSLGRQSPTTGQVDFSGETYPFVAEGFPLGYSRGGLPIILDGSLEGGCGVDGTISGEEDEACACSGIRALQSQ